MASPVLSSCDAPERPPQLQGTVEAIMAPATSDRGIGNDAALSLIRRSKLSLETKSAHICLMCTEETLSFVLGQCDPTASSPRRTQTYHSCKGLLEAVGVEANHHSWLHWRVVCRRAVAVLAFSGAS